MLNLIDYYLVAHLIVKEFTEEELSLGDPDNGFDCWTIIDQEAELVSVTDSFGLGLCDLTNLSAKVSALDWPNQWISAP